MLTQACRSCWSSKNMTTNSRSLPGRSNQSRTSSSAEVRVLWSLTGMLLRLGSHPIVSLSHLRQRRHALVSGDYRLQLQLLLGGGAP